MMLKRLKIIAVLATLALPLAACQDTANQGPPVAISMSDEALGHYCQMYLLDHGGPKAQIHLAGFEQPLWFAQVSDAVAYLGDPEQMADIRGIFVTDMDKVSSWAEVGRDNWIDADNAFYVVDSRQMGGMGTPEALPFSTRASADAFALAEGGQVIALADISQSYVHPFDDENLADAHNEQVGQAREIFK